MGRRFHFNALIILFVVAGCGVDSDNDRGRDPGEASPDGNEHWGGDGDGGDGAMGPDDEAGWGAAAEGEGEAPPGDGGGGRDIDVGIGQGGAQDFAVFRAILEDGGLPLPETLDEMGFFAEHHTELPPPDCGQAICMHAMLGVMGNFINGANCTMLQLGMNARVPEESLQRRPLNLAVAIDTSGSMRAERKLEFVQEGLLRMLDNLEPEDQITVITYSNEARVVAEDVDEEGRDDLRGIIERLGPTGGTNIHDGLRLAFDQVQRRARPEVQNRVILLSDGQATVGITDDEAILAMARPYATEGIGLTTIGVGQDFNVNLMRTLSELGDGNFYYLESRAAIEEVFVEELAYFVTPVATDLRVEVDAGEAYMLRDVFGTRLWQTSANGGHIEIPSVFISHRQAHDDQGAGRRGGGSALLLEMLPIPGWEDFVDDIELHTVSTLRFSYLPAGTNIREEQVVTVGYEGRPGENLEDGFFSGGPAVEKNFVMLNIYVGLQMASERVEWRENGLALSVLESLEGSVAEWLSENHDEDIEDDLAIIRLFEINLLRAGARIPEDEPTPEPWPED